MNQKEIITILKEQYSRTLRKQLVKTIIESEKNGDRVLQEKNYNSMNQIFSYVLHNTNWNIAENATQWDESPLKIMQKVFPQIETTKWFKKQQFTSTQSIDVVIDEDAN